MKRIALIVIAAAIVALTVKAFVPESAIVGEVRLVNWETTHAAEPAEGNARSRDLLNLLRFGAAMVPEALVMQFAYRGGTALGLTAEQARDLEGLLTARYRRIAADPIFAAAPSMIAYCFSAARPPSGAATVFVPESADASTPVIVFLHGFGGSFQFYLHHLATAFADHIVICPAYGISTSSVPSEYLAECLAATGDALKLSLAKPTLVGLSAGGFGGFREYSRHPQRYLGFICLAAFAPDDVYRALPPDGRVRILAGGDEPFVTDGSLAASVARIKGRTPDCDSRLVAGSDHFFLLRNEAQTAEILRAWVAAFEGR